MSSLRPFLPADFDGDVGYAWRDNGDGTSSVIAHQDVGPRLELNRQLANDTDGYTDRSRELRSAAWIPAIIREKWLNEEGWDAYRPDLYAEQLVRKLNDPDWRYLRTAEFRVAAVNGRVR